MVILDSTVWIEFFRKHDPYFSIILPLLEKKEILAVECIFGELLQGVKNNDEQKTILGYWNHLDKIEDTYEIIRAEGLIPRPLGRYKRVLNPNATPYENNIPRPFRARLLIIDAGIYSNKNKLIDKGVGLIDSIILMHGIRNKTKIWTLDGKFLKVIPNELKYTME